jgi:hypothetical protein
VQPAIRADHCASADIGERPYPRALADLGTRFDDCARLDASGGRDASALCDAGRRIDSGLECFGRVQELRDAREVRVRIFADDPRLLCERSA